MKSSRHLGSALLFLLLVALTACWLLRSVDLPSVLTALHQTKKGYILAAAGMMVLFTAGEALKMRFAFDMLGQKISYWKCISFSLVGFYFNAVTPSASGGQPAQLYYMKKDGIQISHSTLALLILALVHLLVMVTYSLLMFLACRSFIMQHLGAMTPLFLFGVIFNLAIFFFILFVIFSPGAAQRCAMAVLRFLQRLRLVKNGRKVQEKLRQQIKEYQDSALLLKKRPFGFCSVSVITVLQSTASFLVPYFIYKGFSLSGFSILEMIAVQAVLNISVSSLPLPGAVGASENGFLLLFRTFFGSQLIFPAMLLCRGINFYALLVFSGIGSLFFYYYLHWHKQAANS